MAALAGKQPGDKIVAGSLIFQVRASATADTKNGADDKTLSFSITKGSDTYVPDTALVKWEKDPDKIQITELTVTPDGNPISGDTSATADVTFTITANASTTLTYKNLQIKWGADLAAFDAVALQSDGTTVIGNLSDAATATFAALVGKADTDKITSGTHTFKVQVKAKTAIQTGKDDKILTFSITKGTDKCVPDTEVVKWKAAPAPVKIELTMNPIGKPKGDHLGTAVFNFKKNKWE